MRRVFLLVLVAMGGIAASGCTAPGVGIAPSTLPLEQNGYVEFSEASGESWGVSVLFIPISTPSTHEAVEDALKPFASPRADGLVKVTVHSQSYFIPPFIVVRKIVVHGRAIKKKDLQN